MAFICLINKSAENSHASFDTGRLAELLCPYQSEIGTVNYSWGSLHHSCLVGTDPHQIGAFLIPFDTQQNPQSAWVKLRLTDNFLRFETDPMGMFPLWCFEDTTKIIITSEVKSLLALQSGVAVKLKPASDLLAFRKRTANFSPFKNVRRIQPGAVLEITGSGDMREVGGLPLQYAPATMFSDIEEAKRALARALEQSAKTIAECAEGFSTFLSGGIDSSTATTLIQRLKPGVNTYTLGTEFGDEYAEAADLASYLKVPHHRVFASNEDALSHFRRAVFCNETFDGLTAETLAQLSVLGKHIPTHAPVAASHVVTGYGADLLFGSMLRHELYMRVTGVDDLQSLIERTCWTSEFSPFFAWAQGLRVHHLFWDPQLMNCAFRIPYEMNYDGKFEKVVLRTLTVDNGWMESSHAFRKKYALTDGTQFNRVLSNVLGIEDKHAYTHKGEQCIEILRSVLGR